MLPGQFSIEQRPLRFIEPGGGQVFPKDAAVLCALGRPEAFLQALARSGVTPVSKMLLPDHDSLDAGTLFESIPANRPIVVTAKDWVKLRERADVGSRSFMIALQTTSVEPATEFRAWLKNRLDA